MTCNQHAYYYRGNSYPEHAVAHPNNYSAWSAALLHLGEILWNMARMIEDLESAPIAKAPEVVSQIRIEERRWRSFEEAFAKIAFSQPRLLEEN